MGRSPEDEEKSCDSCLSSKMIKSSALVVLLIGIMFGHNSNSIMLAEYLPQKDLPKFSPIDYSNETLLRSSDDRHACKVKIIIEGGFE